MVAGLDNVVGNMKKLHVIAIGLLLVIVGAVLLVGIRDQVASGSTIAPQRGTIQPAKQDYQYQGDWAYLIQPAVGGNNR